MTSTPCAGSHCWGSSSSISRSWPRPPGNLVDDPTFATPADAAARFVVAALFSMKFYLLFSFLFGYSFVLQIDGAERAGVRFVPRMLRRVLGLFALGVGHIVLLYGGDVLTTYAVVCLEVGR